MTRVVYGVTAVLVLSCTSCGNRTGLYPVSGTVTYRGAPAAGAVVSFRRHGGEPMNEPIIMGIVRPDGSFDLVCGSLGKGAPPGEYNVLIEWKRFTGQSRGGPRHGTDQLHGRYADPNNPRFRATVRAEPNQLVPFELTD